MEKSNLNIYCLGGPFLSTEWPSIMGDKYRDHMNFRPVIVSSPEEAQVVVWDGVLTPKSSALINDFLEGLSEKTVLLITGEAATLFSDHPYVKLQTKMKDAVHLPPSRVLPEEILEVLDECHRKVTHV
jgi:hypothetical protein